MTGNKIDDFLFFCASQNMLDVVQQILQDNPEIDLVNNFNELFGIAIVGEYHEMLEHLLNHCEKQYSKYNPNSYEYKFAHHKLHNILQETAEDSTIQSQEILKILAKYGVLNEAQDQSDDEHYLIENFEEDFIDDHRSGDEKHPYGSPDRNDVNPESRITAYNLINLDNALLSDDMKPIKSDSLSRHSNDSLASFDLKGSLDSTDDFEQSSRFTDIHGNDQNQLSKSLIGDSEMHSAMSTDQVEFAN